MAEILAKSMKPQVVAAPGADGADAGGCGQGAGCAEAGCSASVSAAECQCGGELVRWIFDQRECQQCVDVAVFAGGRAFGNTRSGRNLYSGGIGLQVDNSAFDAKPYSLTGLDTPKPG